MNRIGVLFVLAVGLAGCSARTHLTEAHGRSYRAFLDRQQAVRTPPYREAEKGLDAQEATIIARSYRQNLSPTDARQREEPKVLIVEQPTGYQARPPQLAPSVPKQ